jgi:hypothetical protein
MSVETYQGKIKNGQIKLSVSVKLPENKKVYVIVPDEDEKPKFDLAKMVKQMPKDYEPHEEDFGEPVARNFGDGKLFVWRFTHETIYSCDVSFDFVFKFCFFSK